ncbi:MAG TPA: sigma-70 family RNA polymerase sigma factor [Gemmatimonadales bacterium]|nr:sigma-70 family RNA polymerase sigma factor [Gemmatimonadales bacterium]
MGDPGITQALVELAQGDTGAHDRLFPLVYDALRAMARRELRRERPDHTLSATALIHEAYLKLVQLDRIDWKGRAHFFGVCGPVMRQVLISHARSRNAAKRGGGEAVKLPLADALTVAEERPEELVALDEALTRLEALSPRQARVVEARFFAGLNVEEAAAALGISPATVKREWTAARAWLNRELRA